jgi:DNA/RNA-binding domain of Phe-tRNA-synthetase-like protein
MIDVRIEPVIAAAAPALEVLTIEAEVTNRPTPEALSALLDKEVRLIADSYEMAMINKRPAIAATRAAYKALGKEPNRYRPSSEALCRRVVKGMGLYRIDALVDMVNLLSMRSGHSIGGFDADKIDGPVITLGRGEAGEPYEGIGRGMLNIEGMPVYRDATGGIGTPTSDNERTKIDLSTRRLLMVVNAYGSSEVTMAEFVEQARGLLEEFCDAWITRIALWNHLVEGPQAVTNSITPSGD